MPGFDDPLRYDGLLELHQALDVVKKDPLRLGRARVRFDLSPSTYSPEPSCTTTRSASPVSSEEQQRRELAEIRSQRQQKHCEGVYASKPEAQFRYETIEEAKRLWRANPYSEYSHGQPLLFKVDEIVKKRWQEQGI